MTDDSDDDENPLRGPSSSSDTPNRTADASASDCFRPSVVFALLCALNFLTYYDRGAAAGCLGNIRRDTSISGEEGAVLSDAKTGAIISAFTIGFFVSCPLFASLGGRFAVRTIISAGAFVWLVGVALTTLSVGYPMLMISRCLVGVGEAAYIGYALTLIATIAPPAWRTLWIGLFYAMIPVGTALGLGVGGTLGDTATSDVSMPGWRVVFATEMVPMVPVFIGLIFLPRRYTLIAARRSSRRDQSPADASNTTIDGHITLLKAVQVLARSPIYGLIVFGYGMYTFALGAVAAWGIPFLEEGPLQMGRLQAAATIGASTCLTGLVGSIGGGVLVDRLGGSGGSRGLRTCLRILIPPLCGAILCGWIAMAVPVAPLSIAAFAVALLLLFSLTAPITSAILSAVPSPLRVYAVSFSVFFIHLLGDFPSPFIAGALSDAFSGPCTQDAMSSGGSNATARALLCRSASAGGECRYRAGDEATQVSDSCFNVFQLRNALLIVWTALCFAAPAWYMAYRRVALALADELNDTHEFDSSSWNRSVSIDE